MSYTKLPYCVLRVVGKSSQSFINTITTSKPPAPDKTIYSTILTPKGRIISDVLITNKSSNTYDISLAWSLLPNLHSHLMKYNLRNALTLSILPLPTYQIFPTAEDLSKYALDPRSPKLGARIHSLPPEHYKSIQNEYLLRRFSLCIPESLEMENELPLAMNVDLNGGIATDKGCYVGQEVVIRALHLGNIRSRTVLLGPNQELIGDTWHKELANKMETQVKIDDSQKYESWLVSDILADLSKERIESINPSKEDVYCDGKKVGKLIGNRIDGYSLAVLKLEALDRSLHTESKVPLFVLAHPPLPDSLPGSWSPYGSTGVVCIHAALLANNSLLCMERPHDTGIYPPNPLTAGFTSTLTSMSATNGTVTPLFLKLNAFCSGLALKKDGVPLVVGGDNGSSISQGNVLMNGRQGIREYTSTGWNIMPQMTTERWYPTVLTLGDGGSVQPYVGLGLVGNDPIINNPTYEYYPTKATGSWPKPLDLLQWAFPFNLYPQSFQLPSGGVFIMASNRSIILNPADESIKYLPDLPALDHRPWIYPYTPTMFVLPATISNGFSFTLMICGGRTISDTDLGSAVCLSIQPDASNPTWTREADLPVPRIMSDSIVLPDGTIAIVNGAKRGEAGGLQGAVWSASQPVYEADVYDPIQKKWTVMASATNKRLYHSGALLIETGEVITFGSEMNNYDDYYGGNDSIRNACFPVAETICTDPFNYNIEKFSPWYISKPRPVIIDAPAFISYTSTFAMKVSNATSITKVVLIRVGSVTHSTNTDQRYIELVMTAKSSTLVYATMTGNRNLAVPGAWMVWVVDGSGVPSVAWRLIVGEGAVTRVVVDASAVTVKNGAESLFRGLVSIAMGLLAFIL